MIAAFALVDDPEPGVLGVPRNVDAVHLTKLRPDGSGKADIEKPKIIIGSPKNLPITLAPVNDLLGLTITEGIEDALSAHNATGRGAWASGGAGRLPALAPTVPSYVETVTLLIDDDDSGRRYGNELACLLHAHGLDVLTQNGDHHAA